MSDAIHSEERAKDWISTPCSADDLANGLRHAADDHECCAELLQHAAMCIEYQQQGWRSDQRLFGGALQIIKEAGLAPGSQELLAAIRRRESEQNDKGMAPESAVPTPDQTNKLDR